MFTMQWTLKFLSWKGMFAYDFLASIHVSSSSSSKDQSRGMQYHSYCASLNKTRMVSRSSGSVVCETYSTPSETSPTDCILIQR
jgi:hypothetical protein